MESQFAGIALRESTHPWPESLSPALTCLSPSELHQSPSQAQEALGFGGLLGGPKLGQRPWAYVLPSHQSWDAGQGEWVRQLIFSRDPARCQHSWQREDWVVCGAGRHECEMMNSPARPPLHVDPMVTQHVDPMVTQHVDPMVTRYSFS